MRYIWMGILMLWAAVGQAQLDSSVWLTKNFKFEDGLFMSYTDFQSNSPAYLWEELQATIYTNPQTFMTQVQSIRLKKDSSLIDLSTVWGLSLGGIPYIRLPRHSTDKQLTVFAGMRLRGKICYYRYSRKESKKVKMPVYNPLTGHPYQTTYVDREEEVIIEKMLDFESGQEADLTVANLKEWVADDPQLLEAIDEVGTEELQSKLFKCLLIYDDRHLVRIKVANKL
ncbi:MAG: hypothetical protein AAFP19_11925 [Bacteroidota bacterium]